MRRIIQNWNVVAILSQIGSLGCRACGTTSTIRRRFRVLMLQVIECGIGLGQETHLPETHLHQPLQARYAGRNDAVQEEKIKSGLDQEEIDVAAEMGWDSPELRL